MSTSILKSKLRKEVLRRRQALGEKARAELSARIVQRVENDPDWRAAKVVCVYVWFKDEVQTDALIQSAWQDGKTVCVPRCGKDGEDKIVLHEIRSFDDLAPGAYGIREPIPNSTPIVAISDVDAFVVPGVAFDRQGNRLGWGGGFYDWTLSRAQGAKKIALAFSCQIVDVLPTEPQDIKMDKVVCEE